MNEILRNKILKQIKNREICHVCGNTLLNVKYGNICNDCDKLNKNKKEDRN